MSQHEPSPFIAAYSPQLGIEVLLPSSVTGKRSKPQPGKLLFYCSLTAGSGVVGVQLISAQVGREMKSPSPGVPILKVSNLIENIGLSREHFAGCFR